MPKALLHRGVELISYSGYTCVVHGGVQKALSGPGTPPAKQVSHKDENTQILWAVV